MFFSTSYNKHFVHIKHSLAWKPKEDEQISEII